MTKPRTQSELAKLALEAKQSRKEEAKQARESNREQPREWLLSKQAYELGELTKLGHGSRSFLYVEIAARRLRALKRGRRTVVLAKDLTEWLEKLPEAKICPAKKNAA